MQNRVGTDMVTNDYVRSLAPEREVVCFLVCHAEFGKSHVSARK